jgi:hypothetical protein
MIKQAFSTQNGDPMPMYKAWLCGLKKGFVIELVGHMVTVKNVSEALECLSECVRSWTAEDFHEKWFDRDVLVKPKD